MDLVPFLSMSDDGTPNPKHLIVGMGAQDQDLHLSGFSG
jgi:hypothetical protein